MAGKDQPGQPLASALANELWNRDMTQDEAAKELGTTQQNLGKWINGRTRPSDSAIPAIARFLGMTEERVEKLRGPTRRTAPGERALLRHRVEELEEKMSAQDLRSEELLRRLEAIANRLDAQGR